MAGIRVELEYSDGNFSTGIARASSSLEKLERQSGRTIVGIKSISEASQGLLGTMRDLTAILGLAGSALHNLNAVSTGVLGSIVRVNAEFEKMTVLLKGMSKAADPLEDAQKQVKFLRDYAREVPFSIRAITDAFTKMKATGIDPMAGALKSLANGVAAMGGGDDHLKRATLALTQMSGKGVIQMEELRQQLGEAMPRAVELMARSMGVSMGKLIKDISTGTVQAKPALAAFYRELDLTFGGAAQEQMKTFNGQMTLLASNTQNLGLKIGEAGFFDAVKSQFTDLNEFMSSKKASVYGEMIGQSLAGGVAMLRQGFEWLLKWKNELGGIAQMIAYGFGARIIVSGVTSLVSGVASMGAAAATTRVQWTLLKREIHDVATAAQFKQSVNRAILQNAAPMSGPASLTSPGLMMMSAQQRAQGSQIAPTAMASFLSGSANAGVGASAAISGVSLAIRSLWGAMGALIPYAPLVIGAIELISLAMGSFKNKTKEAWQELEKFGATSRKQAIEGGKQIQAEENRLEMFKANYAVMQGLNKDNPGIYNDASLGESRAMMEKQENLVAGMKIKYGDLLVEGTKADAEKIGKIDEDRLSEKLRFVSREYDMIGRAEDDAFIKSLAGTDTKNRSTKTMEEQHSADMKRLQIDVYDTNIALVKESIAQQLELLAKGNEQEQIAAGLTLAKRREQLSDLERGRKAREDQTGGTFMLPKQMDDDKLAEKARQFLLGLKADAEGSKAAIMGSTAEVVKLQELMKSGKFGDIETENVKKLVAAIVEAKQEAEDYQKIVNGGQKLENDWRQLNLKLKEEEFDLDQKLGGRKDITATQRQKMKEEAGFYEGYGTATSPAQQRLIDLRKSMQDFGVVSKETGKALIFDVFGSPLMTAMGGFQSGLEKIVQIVNALRNGGSLTGLFAGALPALGDAAGVATGRSTAKGMNDEFSAKLARLIELVPGVSIGGGFRTYDEQAKLYAEKPNLAAPPGTSNHEFGLAADLKFASDAVRRQAHAIAESLGLVFPMLGKNGGKNEPWHVEPVGAKAMRNQPDRPKGVDEVVVDSEIREARVKAKKEQVEFNSILESLDGGIAKTMSKIKSSTKGAMEAALRDDIRSGRGGGNPNDPNDPANNPDAEKWAAAIKKAQDYDAALEKLSAKERLRGKAKSATEDIAKDFADKKRQLEEANKEFADPNQTSLGKQFEAERRQLVERLDLLAQEHGKESEIYKMRAAEGEESLRMMAQSAALKQAADLKQDTKKLLQSQMPEAQAKRAAFQEEVDQKFKSLELEKLTTSQKTAVLETFYAWKKGKEAELNMSGPLAQLGKQWEDLGKNMEQSMASAFSSLTDGVAGMLTGQKVNFQQILQSFAKDMIKNVLNSALAPLMKNMSGMFSGGGAGKFGGGASKAGGASKLASVAHTGGIAGSSALSSRSVGMGLFAGAPKFHTGGIIGSNEVPIIAKKGEGVFTPAQMEAMGSAGGSRIMQLQNNVTVNANGGTPEQNADLSNKISKQVEAQARAMVVDEMRRQMRPGNMLNQ